MIMRLTTAIAAITHALVTFEDVIGAIAEYRVKWVTEAVIV
jgi:hypothetical protein